MQELEYRRNKSLIKSVEIKKTIVVLSKLFEKFLGKAKRRRAREEISMAFYV